MHRTTCGLLLLGAAALLAAWLGGASLADLTPGILLLLVMAMLFMRGDGQLIEAERERKNAEDREGPKDHGGDDQDLR